ncbi:MAG: type II CRISPR RNA-guided endonuclease Cas9 [bacterium]
MQTKPHNFTLGLDIGANSIGWALLECIEDDEGKPEPSKLINAGARVFEAGVEGDIESGKDESRAKTRREARLRRRMLARQTKRLLKLAGILQDANLLPKDDLINPETRLKFFESLDQSLSNNPADPAMLPYYLRARALNEPLQPYELGRALYHLAQRRGFLSTRKAQETKNEKEKEEEGTVKEGIAKLEKEMKERGARTLGEFFSWLDPHSERIRQRWTSRQMFKDEFEAIWSAQTPHHQATLTTELKNKIHNAIFFQRPLKSQKRLIGICELEPNQKRAPLAILPAQRHRLLQNVNNLKAKKIDKKTGEIIDRPLSQDERNILIHELETKGDLKFSQIRELLDLKGFKFNFEESEEKIIGNRTASKLIEIFGKDNWENLPDFKKDEIVEKIRTTRKEHVLAKYAQEKLHLDPEKANKFAELFFEEGYCSLSLEALKKILPLMEQGIQYATARKEIYGEQPPPEPLESLPPYDFSSMPELRNPTVKRVLTELRKVVNAVIRKYGKPDSIRIELARDLKKPRKERKAIHLKNQENRRKRDKAAEKLLTEADVRQPTRDTIEKWLLYEECNQTCPYTNKHISVASLFGPTPQFDTEHIIPFSRCLDNSFINKTLCEVEENRNIKKNKTPREAYGQDKKKWSEILQRVKQFKGDAKEKKLDRFQLKDLESLNDFVTRQLNDTQYAARTAIRYLGLLYGAGVDGNDPNGKKRVQAGRGQVTGYLRNELNLNRILNDGGTKSRDDHRHHAIDAICIALTDARTVKMLSDAAARAPQKGRRRFAEIPPPWDGFLNDVRTTIDNIIASHRVSRKVNTAFHEETIYSKPHKDENGRECTHVRKPISSLSKSAIDDIVDPVIRELVRAKLHELGGDPKSFRNPENHPFLEAKKHVPACGKQGSGKKIPIHSARIRVYDKTMRIGTGARERNIMTGANHHVEIYEYKDEKGHIKWDGEVVSVYEAMQRLRNKQPIINRDQGEGKKFLFSLACGETIQLEKDGKVGLYVVRSVPASKQIFYVNINDSRKKNDIIKSKDWFSGCLEPLRKLNCRKVLITPLGEVLKAND